MTIAIERIAKRHQRQSFNSGNPKLDRYLHHHARQNDCVGLGVTYVAVFSGKKTVLGYYTLASAQIERDILPDAAARGLPRYPVPAVLLARLAVDKNVQGQGLGKRLLIHAMRQSLYAGHYVGWNVMVVDAIDGQAVRFYKHYGFTAFTDDCRHLFLPMKRIAKIFSSEGA